jgi:energy-coupling factor transporter ATP-binding protein EcfA2
MAKARRSKAKKRTYTVVSLPPSRTPNTLAITSIEVRGLFGIFDYDLKPEGVMEADKQNRLLILYGDNGSGKTTILKLVYHLLSPEDRRGHRTFIAGVPFRSLDVRLGNEIRVEAIRDQDRLIGSYLLRISRSDTIVAEARLPTDENNVVQIRDDDITLQRTWAHFISQLTAIGLSLSYLPDDRNMESAFHSPQDAVALFGGSDATDVLLRQRVARLQLDQRSVLETAVKRAEDGLRSASLQAATTGEADTNKIYADVVKRVAKSGRNTRGDAEPAISLLSQLTELQARSKAYSALGLMSPLSMEEVIDALHKAKPQKRQIMSEVLRPYVNGLEARLKALQNVQTLIQDFLDGVNKFLTNKRVDFSLTAGITIRSSSGQNLFPAMLSSGEKQLLLLFCNTIAARQSRSIFIIDEPEISLNVKWQRRLLDALLRLVGGTELQFLIATHSIELLAQYSSHVIQLRNASSPHDRA